MALTHAEMGYHANLKEMPMMEYAKEDHLLDFEVAGVGAGLGGEALAADWEGWTKMVEEEHERMANNQVWTPIKLSKVPKGAKILTFIWACKMKSNGEKRVHFNGRGYEQIDGVHYNSTSFHAPVTNEACVHIVMVLTLMADWIGQINNMKSAFLKGTLDGTEQMYMHVPKGFKKYYLNNVVLLL
eukprot:1321705-Ditylum_brightwellii.AAC.1